MTDISPAVPSLIDLLLGFLDAMVRQKGLSNNTVEAYRRDLQRYIEALAGHDVDHPEHIRPEHITQLLDRLRDEGLSPATLARNLSSIRRFHSFLLVEGVTRQDPSAGVAPPKLERRLPDFIAVEEMERLLQSPSTDEPLGLRDRAIVELLYASGMRVSELIALQKPNLMTESSLVRIVQRNGRPRLVPIGRQAILYADKYLNEVRPQIARADADSTVFLNAQGRALSRMSIWKIIRTAADKAGLDKPISPHTLRHSFAAHLLAGGAHLRDIQELLGHTDINTTQIYSHIDSKYLKDIHRAYHPRG
ncbi:MAG: site-specific tyrosine recombinase XerD [Candidatus Latescibacteria bacterium]|nr:site-specific tyrosine recombinase XerD [Candidatus Latescibacterota bacterium]